MKTHLELLTELLEATKAAILSMEINDVYDGIASLTIEVGPLEALDAVVEQVEAAIAENLKE